MRVCVTPGVTCKVRYKCGYRNGGLYLYWVGGYNVLGKRSKQLKFFCEIPFKTAHLEMFLPTPLYIFVSIPSIGLQGRAVRPAVRVGPGGLVR